MKTWTQRPQAMFTLLTVAFVLAIVFLPALDARAQPCKAMATVQASAVASANTAAGGHLTQHINGMDAPPGLSQAGKTLWTSESEYKGAWNNYQKSTTIVGVACTGLGTKRQVVTVQNLLSKPSVGAFNCTAGPNGGQCTAKTRTQCTSIQFDFINNAGNWILQTAYPMTCKS